VNEVSKLKHQLDGDIVVYASFQLVQALVEHDLIDELRLTIFPFVLGAGQRLLDETNNKIPMHLINSTTIGDHLVFLAYQPVENA
jgi:dihydrofolate reductase